MKFDMGAFLYFICCQMYSFFYEYIFFCLIMQKHHPIQNNDPRVLVLDRGNYTTCTVFLKGATITSWRIEGEEQIFLSRASCLDDYNKYRGGIALVFPQFNLWNFGRQHGFARDLSWSLKQGPIINQNGDVYLELFLRDNPFTRSCWDFEFELRYSILLKTTQLETRMIVINPSRLSSFQFNFEQHWYIKVNDISKVSFTGLKGLKYVDQLVMGSPSKFALHDGKLKSEGRTHLTFPNSPEEIFIINEEENKVIKVTKMNLPDFHLWNPWENAKHVDDLDEDEVRFFIALDSGNVVNKKYLAPNSYWKAAQTFEVIKTDKTILKYNEFLHFFEYVC